MLSTWLNHLSKEERSEFKSRVLLAAPVLERLSSIVDMKLQESSKDILKKANYDSPSWALMQADHTGYTRALNEVTTFLTLEK